MNKKHCVGVVVRKTIFKRIHMTSVNDKTNIEQIIFYYMDREFCTYNHQ